MTVLVIDDDSDSLEVLSTFLRACSAYVLIARNAGAGLAYVDKAPALDAVVSDLAMPDMDGVEFARRVRRHPTRNGLPIIAVTAFYEQYPDSAEFDAWLRKPLDVGEVCALIGRLVQRRRSSR
jgi:CheY-like chemotaxis protein